MSTNEPGPESAVPQDGRRSRRTSAAVVIAAALLMGGVLLIPPATFRGPDFQRLHAPLKGYWGSALGEGRLPLWNPHVALGRPLLADPEAGVFYPATLLFLVMDVRSAAILTMVAHLALALFGVVHLARKLGAAPGPSHVAMLFAASTGFFALFQGGSVNYACSFCWMPLVLASALALRDHPSLRGVASLSLLFGLQLVCHPQPAWLSGYAAAALVIGAWRGSLVEGAVQTVRVLGLLSLALVWGAAIAAVQLLPLAELIGQSNRATGSFELASSFASPLAAWATLWLPAQGLTDIELSGQLYAGSAVAIAGIAGLTRVRDQSSRALLAMAIAAGLLAAGDSTPFFRGLYHLVPFLSMIRVPARAGVLVALAIALAAPLYLSRRDANRTEIRRLLVVGVSSALLAALFSRLPELRAMGDRLPFHLLSTVGAAALLGVVLCSSNARWRRAAYGGLALLTAVELAFQVMPLKVSIAGPADFPGERMLRDTLLSQGFMSPGSPPPRISIPYPAVRENAGMEMGWSTFTGFGPAYLGRVWDAVHELRGLQPPVTRNVFPADNIYDDGPFPYDGMSLVVGYDRRSARVAVRKEADPRAWLVQRAVVVADARGALLRMRLGHDVHVSALLEAPLASPLDASAPAGKVRIVRFLPEAIDLEVESPGSALLLLGEAWYPGWTAKVDGRPASVLPANGWMRAAPVPAGASHVEMRFHSTWLLPGALLSLLALGAAILLRRAPRAHPA